MKDVQNYVVKSKPIQKVGIREVYGEVIYNNKTIPANFSVYVDLKEKKGIHMSRLSQTILECSPIKITKKNIVKMLNKINKKSGDFSKDAYVKIGFNYAKEILSPVTKLKNIFSIPIKVKAKRVGKDTIIDVEMIVSYTSLCPCSKEISKYSAHNQRSYATITFTLGRGNIKRLVERVYGIVTKNASSPIYNVLKRPDEKYVTEKAYENPRFVEDMSRLISEGLDKLINDELISDYSVVINHEESIHQHNAVAILYYGKRLK